MKSLKDNNKGMLNFKFSTVIVYDSVFILKFLFWVLTEDIGG